MKTMNYIEEEEYKKILMNIPICCVDIILYNDNKEILLVKRDKKPAKNEYWFPGGRVLKNEKLKDCAIRKIEEEVGLKVNEVKYLCTYETIFEDGPFSNVNTHSINICFYAKIDSNQKISLNEFHSNFKFIKEFTANSHKYLKNCYKEFCKKIN